LPPFIFYPGPRGFMTYRSAERPMIDEEWEAQELW